MMKSPPHTTPSQVNVSNRSSKSHEVLRSAGSVEATRLPTLLSGRADLAKSQRIVVKAGTAIVSAADGRPSLTRLAALVEQIGALRAAGKEVLLISSGSVGCGRRKVPEDQIALGTPARVANSARAAAGQIALMALYEHLFGVLDVQVAQVLVCNGDFADAVKVKNLVLAVDALLHVGVPIVNENDLVSYASDTSLHTFCDNDELAMLFARHLHADLLVVLTDVPGVFNRNPQVHANASIVRTLTPRRLDAVEMSGKSNVGRGGMRSKVNACLAAVRVRSNDAAAATIAVRTAAAAIGSETSGDDSLPYDPSVFGEPVGAALIANGREPDVLLRAVAGENVGTLIVSDSRASAKLLNEPLTNAGADSSLAADDSVYSELRTLALGTRNCQRALALLSHEKRNEVLLAIAEALERRTEDIVRINEVEVERERKASLAAPLLKRLLLSREKLASLAAGLRGLAAQADPIGGIEKATELAEDLTLVRTRVPIGVLLVVFESRPDALVQIAALAVKSGNGVILKGGSEARDTCSLLHKIIVEAITRVAGSAVESAVTLVHTRDDVAQLLQCDSLIDLVIPRGSNALVRRIKATTRIPVLGHADGVCHVFVDADADMEQAQRLCVDSKLDYPAACNALETLLLHESLIEDTRADALLRALRVAGVHIMGGPNAVESGLVDIENAVKLRDGDDGTDPMHIEYGDATLCVEVVSSLDEAIDHINTHGSAHTDVIVTSNEQNARQFCQRVDSACVFHNTSSRFADGYRFGYGAEVGIATGRVHARGPVGVEGLVITKSIVKCTRPNGAVYTVGEKPHFTHQPIEDAPKLRSLKALL